MILEGARGDMMNGIADKIPLIGTLQSYSLNLFRRDLIAGLTVAVVAIPQALSYASIAGLDGYLHLGLYTVIVSVMIASIFGSSNFLIAGTTNAIALLILSNTGKFNTQGNYLELLFLMTFLTGVIQILFAVFKLGKALNFVSHSVIVGFTAGAGVLIAFGQLNGLLGIRTPPDLHSSQAKLLYVLQHLESANPYSVGIGLLTIGVILLLRKINRNIPGSLTGIIVAGVTVMWLDLDKMGVKLTGSIPTGLPPFKMITFDWGMISQVFNAAVVIAIIGLVEAMAIAKSLATKAGQKLDTNQEILAQGLSNAGSSFFQCYAGSGSFTRSAVNYISGAATRCSGIFSGIFVAIILLFFGQYARYIPAPGLAGVVLLIAYGMIGKVEIKKILAFGRGDKVALLITMVATIVLPEVSMAVGVGVAVSIMLYLRNSGSVPVKVLVAQRNVIAGDNAAGYGISEKELDCVEGPVDVLTVQIEGNLYFGSAPDLEAKLEGIEDKARIFILRLRRVSDIDMTTLEVLKRFIDRVKSDGRDVLISCVNREIGKVVEQFKLVEQVGSGKLFMAEEQLFASYEKALIKADEMVCSFKRRDEQGDLLVDEIR